VIDSEFFQFECDFKQLWYIFVVRSSGLTSDQILLTVNWVFYALWNFVNGIVILNCLWFCLSRCI
jgi:hypothetical protein